MKPVLRLMVFANLLALFACANAEYYVRFLGRTPNWFDPTNWSTGRVPDRDANVFIAGNSRVVIDPALGSSIVAIRSLELRGNAILETRPGTEFSSENESIGGNSQLLFHSSTSTGGSDEVGPGLVSTNPTTQSMRTYVLKSSATLVIGLGGTEPATLTHTGAGTYATINAEDLEVGGELQISLHNGLRPRSGHVFRIMSSSGRMTGQFRGLRNGAMVARFGNVGLFIQYGVPNPTTQTREHILLARQVGL